jgi:hydrogenase maturation factor
MVLVVDSKAASAVLSTLAEASESGAMLIGEVVEGDQQVLYV